MSHLFLTSIFENRFLTPYSFTKLHFFILLFVFFFSYDLCGFHDLTHPYWTYPLENLNMTASAGIFRIVKILASSSILSKMHGVWWGVWVVWNYSVNLSIAVNFHENYLKTMNGVLRPILIEWRKINDSKNRKQIGL